MPERQLLETLWSGSARGVLWRTSMWWLPDAVTVASGSVTPRGRSHPRATPLTDPPG
jgi:hypothetical protein